MTSPYAQDIQEIKSDVKELTRITASTREAVAELTTLVSQMHDTCPYREVIARANENHNELKEVKQQITDNRITIAKMLSVGAVGAGLVEGLKLLVQLFQ